MKSMQEKLLKNNHFWSQAMYSATVLCLFEDPVIFTVLRKKIC